MKNKAILDTGFYTISVYSESNATICELLELVYPYAVQTSRKRLINFNIEIYCNNDSFIEIMNNIDDNVINLFIFGINFGIKETKSGTMYVSIKPFKNMVLKILDCETVQFVFSDYKLGLYDLNRLVRLLKVAFLEKNCLSFHGSAIAIKNQGIAFLGEKFSGKTTFLMKSLINLKNQGAAFVSNDDLYIDNNKLWGSNRSISVRKITFDKLGILPPKSTYQLPIQKRNEIWRTKYRYKPQELMTKLGIGLEPEVPLKRIVILKYSKSNSFFQKDYKPNLNVLSKFVLPPLENNLFAKGKDKQSINKRLNEMLTNYDYSFLQTNENNILNFVDELDEFLLNGE